MDRAQDLLDESTEIYEYYLELPIKRYRTARRHTSRIWASLFATLLCALMVYFDYTIGTTFLLRVNVNGSEVLLNGLKISILIACTYIAVFLIVYIIFSIARKKP